MDAACTTEVHKFCARDATLLTLMESAGNRDENKIRQRRQRVRDCLIDRAEELTSDCVNSLLGDISTTHSAALPADDEAAAEPAEAVTTPGEDAEAEGTDPKIAPVVQILKDPAPVEPVAAAPLPQVQVRPQVISQEPTEEGVEVRIFLINHPAAAQAAAPASPPYLRIGGDSNQYTGGGDHALSASTSTYSSAMPAWLWVSLLPFFCVGVYVSVTKGIAYIRRRRDAVYQVSSSSQGYRPIPSSLGGKL